MSNGTENVLRVRVLFINQLLTEENFRASLKAAQGDEAALKKVLTDNGYSEALYELVKEIDYSDLESSKITKVMPNDVELTSMGGNPFQW